MELGPTDHHRVAFSTSYKREWINSKITENDNFSKRPLVQLTGQTKPFQRSLSLIPTPTNYFKNQFLLKIDNFRQNILSNSAPILV